LQWTLFYGLFIADSAVSLRASNKFRQGINKHYLYFVNEILNNKQLKPNQMKKAAQRFLTRISTVSETEKAKALETLHKKLGHELLPSEMAARLEKKRDKKSADLDLTLGLDPSLLEKIIQSPDPINQILECFEKTIAQQDVQKFMAIICLVINALGLPCDIPALRMGIDGSFWNITVGLGWGGVNGASAIEDMPGMGYLTRLLRKIGSKPHQKTHWWSETHHFSTTLLN
jgi:hypothetical protein